MTIHDLGLSSWQLLVYDYIDNLKRTNTTSPDSVTMAKFGISNEAAIALYLTVNENLKALNKTVDVVNTEIDVQNKVKEEQKIEEEIQKEKTNKITWILSITITLIVLIYLLS